MVDACSLVVVLSAQLLKAVNAFFSHFLFQVDVRAVLKLLPESGDGMLVPVVLHGGPLCVAQFTALFHVRAEVLLHLCEFFDCVYHTVKLR